MNPEEDIEKLSPPNQKKEASYTYWVNNDPNFFKEGLKPEIVPQKLETHQIENASPAKHSNVIAGHSAWNTAGTWEEKKLKFEDVLAVFNTEFQPYQLDEKIEINKIADLTGEAHLVLSRGKKRMGYHLKFTLFFEGLGDWKNENGKILFTEFTDDGEREMKIECGKDEIKSLIRKKTDFISESFLNILNLLKN